jgi:hypothetical protein
MNLGKFFTVAIVSVGLLVGANKASAAIVDFSGDDINMGTLAIGQSGTISADSLGSLVVNSVQGVLPVNSLLTFTYNFSGNLLAGVLAAGSEYTYTAGGVDFAGSSLSVEPLGLNYASGTENGAPSSALAFSSAQVDFTGNTASAIISNESAGVLDFSSVFVGLVIGDRNLDIAYNVSAVPLPGALPLFGLGLAAMAGYNMRRKKKMAA